MIIYGVLVSRLSDGWVTVDAMVCCEKINHVLLSLQHMKFTKLSVVRHMLVFYEDYSP